MIRLFFGVVLTLFLLTSAERRAHATTTLKIGTMAPRDSPWGRDFRQWAKDVSDDTHGEVQLDFLWNVQAGDETLMVQKIRIGQLDGAHALGVSTATIDRLCRDGRIPYVHVRDARRFELDAVRSALRTQSRGPAAEHRREQQQESGEPARDIRLLS